MLRLVERSRGIAASGDGQEWTQRVGACATLPALVRQLGADPALVLADAGLAPDALDDPEARVPFGAFVAMLDACAARTGCAHAGLLVGRLWHLEDLGLIGDLARNAPTVRDALNILVVRQHLNSDGALGFLLERGETVDFGYAIYQPGVTHARQLSDGVLAAYFNFLRELCGPSWLPTEALLTHSKPADAAPYRWLLKVRPRFDAEYCALRFPARWMDRPVEGADPAQYRLALRRAAELGATSLIQQVFRALRTMLLHGKTSGDDVAYMLSMHRRTLNRRLKAAGTTFQQVLDQVRFDVARQLLRDSNVALDDVAAALGYTSVSSFMRTFRRWSGTTPRRWRQAATTGAPTDGTRVPDVWRSAVPAERHPHAGP